MMRVCPNCHYPTIAWGRMEGGWFCLNGGCPPFESPLEVEDDTMSFAEFVNIVNDLSMPGGGFNIGVIDQGFFVQFVSGEQHGRKWYVSKHSTESEVVMTALMAAIAFAEHEVREQFRYKGKNIFHPHPSIDALLGVAEQREVRA